MVLDIIMLYVSIKLRKRRQLIMSQLAFCRASLDVHHVFKYTVKSKLL